MDPTVLKRTQETLGRLIKKPPLTDKLLNKPPFRFLHDIITEVIRTTGFMKGLYSDTELKSENVKEKDMKLQFLQKAVDVVVMVSGQSLSVKPARIIAGHEPERTNELLQALAFCCLNKLSSEDAVRRVLSGEKPDAKNKPPSSRSATTEEKTKRSKTEEPKERQKNRESSEQRQREPPQSREPPHREPQPREHREKGKKERSSDREKEKVRDRGDAPREKERERRRRDQDRTRTRTKEEDQNTQVKTEDPQNVSPEEPPKANTESSARIPRPSSAKGQRRRAQVGSQDESDSEGDAEAQKNVLEASTEAASDQNHNPPPPNDNTTSNRRMVRPSSARPAPPRVKRQESHTESPAERLSSAKPAVILDGRRTEEEENDEDQQFLVQEALPQTAVDTTDNVNAEDEADPTHGGLVKKILETKKYYEVSPSSPKAQGMVPGEAQRKERELVRREIHRLQASVQTVCRSALPLGKIMDYIQEDMDAMKNELQQWRQENKEHAQALTSEYRATELAVLPLKSELSELEDLIQEQQAQICAVRSTILKNEEKIQRMVTGIQH